MFVVEDLQEMQSFELRPFSLQGLPHQNQPPLHSIEAASPEELNFKLFAIKLLITQLIKSNYSINYVQENLNYLQMKHSSTSTWRFWPPNVRNLLTLSPRLPEGSMISRSRRSSFKALGAANGKSQVTALPAVNEESCQKRVTPLLVESPRLCSRT